MKLYLNPDGGFRIGMALFAETRIRNLLHDFLLSRQTTPRPPTRAPRCRVCAVVVGTTDVRSRNWETVSENGFVCVSASQHGQIAATYTPSATLWGGSGE